MAIELSLTAFISRGREKGRTFARNSFPKLRTQKRQSRCNLKTLPFILFVAISVSYTPSWFPSVAGSPMSSFRGGISSPGMKFFASGIRFLQNSHGS